MNQQKIYEIITQKIVDELEKGVVPWSKPWRVDTPRNFVSKKAYRGINWMSLGIQTKDYFGEFGDEDSYECPFWLTFKQAQAKGGKIRKGEKATPVTFWKTFNKDVENDSGDTETRKLFVLRYYNVFNLEQTEGIDIPERAERVHVADDAAEKLVADYLKGGPSLKHEGQRACYSPYADSITMPAAERFESSDAYYGTLYHEITHSTGHESRLARKGVTDVEGFGSHGYGQEELVAEMGAAFLAGIAGLSGTLQKNNAAYLQSWLKVVKDDRKLLVQAASQAQKAVDLVTGVEEETQAPGVAQAA